MISRLALLECSLADTERAERETRWRAVGARALERSETRLVLPSDPSLAAELAELAALESACCGAAFDLSIDATGIRLTLRR